jgi:hypothetical protein
MLREYAHAPVAECAENGIRETLLPQHSLDTCLHEDVHRARGPQLWEAFGANPVRFPLVDKRNTFYGHSVRDCSGLTVIQGALSGSDHELFELCLAARIKLYNFNLAFID